MSEVFTAVTAEVLAFLTSQFAARVVSPLTTATAAPLPPSEEAWVAAAPAAARFALSVPDGSGGFTEVAVTLTDSAAASDRPASHVVFIGQRGAAVPHTTAFALAPPPADVDEDAADGQGFDVIDADDAEAPQGLLDGLLGAGGQQRLHDALRRWFLAVLGRPAEPKPKPAPKESVKPRKPSPPPAPVGSSPPTVSTGPPPSFAGLRPSADLDPAGGPGGFTRDGQPGAVPQGPAGSMVHGPNSELFRRPPDMHDPSPFAGIHPRHIPRFPGDEPGPAGAFPEGPAQGGVDPSGFPYGGPHHPGDVNPDHMMPYSGEEEFLFGPGGGLGDAGPMGRGRGLRGPGGFRPGRGLGGPGGFGGGFY